MRSSDNQLSDDRITRETLSYNNPCPSSPSSTIYIYIKKTTNLVKKKKKKKKEKKKRKSHTYACMLN